jgi:hypothetical protein
MAMSKCLLFFEEREEEEEKKLCKCHDLFNQKQYSNERTNNEKLLPLVYIYIERVVFDVFKKLKFTEERQFVEINLLQSYKVLAPKFRTNALYFQVDRNGILYTYAQVRVHSLNTVEIHYE